MSASTTQPIPTPPEEPAAPRPEDLIAEPAVQGDLTAELKQVARPFGKPTLVLAGLLVLALAFAGGAWTHAAFGPSSGSSGGARTAFAGTGSGPGAGQQGGSGGRAAGGRGTVGTVEKVDGSTITVKTMQGSEVTVSTSDSTTVGVTQPGKLSDLKPGQPVTVQGRTGADGSVTAQAIVAQPGR
ncbi:hypothetical protein G3I59_26640 [Amycolatopsis rubida]|uniref:DUF5666 domain-containing protein n=1 Tax=Amycolatopsis rubida TaxID=112413 RepID=A0A1I5DK16_9PSEU|nr:MULTISPECIES: DUF5666 domain-containing protein [Amycolatopsis]MYW94088.1 hypothetical protein [Amycolatopsis rubida]NEC59077.1 hypothetical protein [Amycolatopsis rubida]OAP22038.1 hypothetical protein A4R44_07155 [Amycolatopsis sp. M39]SFN99553.1 hypothetical protein SAMN05421854_101255 [Amycolatopsis rubida]